MRYWLYWAACSLGERASVRHPHQIRLKLSVCSIASMGLPISYRTITYFHESNHRSTYQHTVTQQCGQAKSASLDLACKSKLFSKPVAFCRAFPPHHPLIPVDYQLTGQPVLIGGTMGTNSYILTGTQKGMQETFGSTCHGAGRARSRNNARTKLDYQEVGSSSVRSSIPHQAFLDIPERRIAHP